MGIIALLALLVLTVVVTARHHARDAACKSNLAQLWKAVNYFANNSGDVLFVNTFTPLRISNVIYKARTVTGWGHLYPKYVQDNRLFFCPDDPARDLQWEFGWKNWESDTGEVQCSYGYRGRQGIVADAVTALTLSEIERNPQKVFGCDYYETFAAPPRVHHAAHINVLRCNGSVGQVGKIVSFGPTDPDFQAALDALDQ